MTSPDSNPNQIDANPVFATTRWSVVLAAGLSHPQHHNAP
jgi:hypothetical protein